MPARTGSRVTRADVARYAEVSAATVSYVLNGSAHRVSAGTRDRVLEAVRVLGYRPNAAARALSKGAADMFGMVVVDGRNPFFAQLAYELDLASVRHRRSLLTMNADRVEGGTVDLVADLVARQIGGLIVAEVLSAADQAVVAALDIPVVFINQFAGDARASVIGVDLREGARQGVTHLIEHGYRDIAFIGSDQPFDQRERGWSDALSDAGLPRGRIVHSGFGYRGGYEAAKGMIAQGAPPRAVFTASDQIAMGFLAALSEHGVAVPEDVAVVSFDGIAEAAYMSPSLTTVAQPIAEIAEEAVARLEAGDPMPGVTTMPTTLVLRRSCGCPVPRL